MKGKRIGPMMIEVAAFVGYKSRPSDQTPGEPGGDLGAVPHLRGDRAFQRPSSPALEGPEYMPA